MREEARVLAGSSEASLRLPSLAPRKGRQKKEHGKWESLGSQSRQPVQMLAFLVTAYVTVSASAGYELRSNSPCVPSTGSGTEVASEWTHGITLELTGRSLSR